MRRALASLLLMVSAFVHADSARAAELIMFEDAGCIWCVRWHQEIGPGYPKTSEGQLAPLRVENIRDARRLGLELDKPVTSTPTFVLVDRDKEIGRITGYPGSEFFYGLLGGLLKKLPPPQAPAPDQRAELRSAQCVGPMCVGPAPSVPSLTLSTLRSARVPSVDDKRNTRKHVILGGGSEVRPRALKNETDFAIGTLSAAFALDVW